MCKRLCGYDREPANSKEAKIWRKVYYNNHDAWPRNPNVNKKQVPAPAPDPVASKSSPAEEWQQGTLFDMPKPNYLLNH
jgi:hypothetical protein